MSYAVKEIFYTLQGEGANVGRPAVFCRFSGCNLWSGREVDRAKAICCFCDTEFVGTDGVSGAKYETAAKVAGTVAAAIAACYETPVDLMLLDVTLPDGDGLDVLAQATTTPRVTLALTGWDEPAVIARCRAAGCRDVLLKPVSARTLLALTATLTT